MKRRIWSITVAALVVVALTGVSLSVPSPVSAKGMTQISGMGFYAEPGECSDPQGLGSDYALKLTGDLVGCHYVFIQSAVCSPGGTYRESGFEIFVAESGGNNTFMTNYKFEAKYQDCNNLVGEIIGRCQHPIVAGSGRGIFEGATGRLDFIDDVVALNFPYRGHIK